MFSGASTSTVGIRKRFWFVEVVNLEGKTFACRCVDIISSAEKKLVFDRVEVEEDVMIESVIVKKSALWW